MTPQSHALAISSQRWTAWHDPVIAAEIDALSDAEGECRPFLTMTVARTEGRLVLDVVGPSGD